MKLRMSLWAIYVFGFFLGSLPSSAALLFSGGEDIDFICNPSGSCSVDTHTSDFRTNWAREAYQVTGSSSDPATNRFATAPFTASSTLWVHAQLCATFSGGCNDNDTTANAQMIRILDSSGNPTLLIRGTGTTGQVKISSRTASGVFTDLVTCPGTIGVVLQQIDFYINYSTTGEVTLYKNSVPVCDFTGNVVNGDGATTLNQVEFASASSSYVGSWSEIIVATTDTRAMARFTANTVANGASVGFSGTNVCSAIWKATAYDDTSYGYTGTSNVTHECTVNSSIPPGAYAVEGLTMSARTLVGTSGPQHFEFVTRTGGADYTSPDIAPTNSFSNSTNYIQTVNPATGTPWTVPDLQNAGFNVGEKATP